MNRRLCYRLDSEQKRKGCTDMKSKTSLFPGFCLLAALVMGFLAVDSTPVSSVQESQRSSLYYIVREGDCLWSISGHLYQDPHQWRFLWQNNPYIGDPHWIYPGDPIYLGFPAEQESPMGPPVAAEAGSREAVSGPSEEMVGIRPSILHVQRRMADVALVSGDLVRTAGAIVAGPDRRMLLSFGDEVYVQFAQEVSEAGGARYQVLRPIREVRHPETGDRIGMLYRILGSLAIQEYGKDRLARARIVESQDAMETGDLIREGDLPPREIPSKLAVREVGGTIVAGLGKEEEIAQHQICFIDRGVQDGVEIGDEFLVFQERGEVKGYPGEERVRLPDERVGLLVVVHAEQGASTALVAESRSSLSVGNSVKARTE